MAVSLTLTVDDAQFLLLLLQNQTMRGNRQQLAELLAQYDRVTAVLTAIIENEANRESGEPADTHSAA